MKKVLLFAAAAAMMAACSNTDELASLQTVQENNQEVGINFDVYAGKTATRAGLPGGYDATEGYGVTTKTLTETRHAGAGFGVFAYYTSNSEYDTNSSTPDFMYNQKVVYNTTWTYEPVKYWPNEFGNAAKADDMDHVTFFAYAPWQQVKVNTGVPGTDIDAAYVTDHMALLTETKIIELLGFADKTALEDACYLVIYAEEIAKGEAPADADATATSNKGARADQLIDAYKTAYQADMESRLADQKLNITQMSRNTASGDPIVKYVVDMHPNTSVDLLWGVAADANFKGIKDENGDPTSTQKAGNCFVDLTKQGDVDGKIKWNFKHALARLNVQICTVVDKATPGEGATEIGTEGDGTVDNATKVWLRSITFTNGFAQKGALNLHSDDVSDAITDPDDRVKAALPKWLDYDGTSELTFDDVTLYDGLKDGKEGTTNNVAPKETPIGINPILTQADPAYTGVPIKLTNLFAGALTPDDPIYVIPDPNQDQNMEITINYDVETANKRLPGYLSDGVTHGLSVNNNITKKLAESPAKFQILPGYAYVIKIYLGIESVKFDVEVKPWTDPADASTEVELPANE